jgi:uncharacterized membrane protein
MKIHTSVSSIVALCAIAMLAFSAPVYAWNFTVPAQEIKPVNGVFAFPVESFADGKAKHFQYTISPNERVRFFIVKSTDGVVRAALDACEVCKASKKGYVQQGNDMICINCGLKFRTDKVNEVRGGCNPHPLKRTIQGDKLVINAQEVADGLAYFR